VAATFSAAIVLSAARNVVPAALHHAGHQVADYRLVLDHQDGSLSPRGGGLGLRGAGLDRGLVVRGR